MIPGDKEPLSNSSKLLPPVQKKVDGVPSSASADTAESFILTESSFSLKFSSGIFSNQNKKFPNTPLNKSTPDFTTKRLLHQSTPLKVAATKEKLDPIRSGIRENIIGFNKENVFTLEEKKNLSKNSKILEKITRNDILVHLYDKVRKMLKSIKSNENILTYKNIVAKREVKVLPLCNTFKKQLKDIETETLIKSDIIMLKPESGPSQVHCEKNLNKLKLIAVMRKELEI